MVRRKVAMKEKEYAELLNKTNLTKSQLELWGFGVNPKKRMELLEVHEEMVRDLHILDAQVARLKEQENIVQKLLQNPHNVLNSGEESLLSFKTYYPII
jgi:hypothetical protein